jgi:hypothetical protein
VFAGGADPVSGSYKAVCCASRPSVAVEKGQPEVARAYGYRAGGCPVPPFPACCAMAAELKRRTCGNVTWTLVKQAVRRPLRALPVCLPLPPSHLSLGIPERLRFLDESNMEWLEGHQGFMQLGVDEDEGDIELTWEAVEAWVAAATARVRGPADGEALYAQERASTLGACKQRRERVEQRLREYEAMVTGVGVDTPGAFVWAQRASTRWVERGACACLGCGWVWVGGEGAGRSCPCAGCTK